MTPAWSCDIIFGAVLVLLYCYTGIQCNAVVKYWTSLIISRADTVCVLWVAVWQSGSIKRLQHLICTLYTAQ